MKIFACLLLTGMFLLQSHAQLPQRQIPTRPVGQLPLHSASHNIPSRQGPGATSADFLDIYAKLNGKTILRPCGLPNGLNLSDISTNQHEAVIAIQKAYAAVGYEFVSDGEKFIRLLETGVRTNTLFTSQLSRFQLPAVNTKASDIPAGSVFFQNAPINQVLDYYAALRGCKIRQPAYLPATCISFRAQQALTQEEVSYALNITMVLNGLVPVDEADKTVAIYPINQAPPVKAHPK